MKRRQKISDRIVNVLLTVLGEYYKGTCNSYFKKAFSCKNPLKVFTITSWINPFPEPTSPFNTLPPTYCEINKIIKRMKASGSPCPLDQKPIICFKKCPFLRSYSLAICEKNLVYEAYSISLV